MYLAAAEQNCYTAIIDYLAHASSYGKDEDTGNWYKLNTTALIKPFVRRIGRNEKILPVRLQSQ